MTVKNYSVFDGYKKVLQKKADAIYNALNDAGYYDNIN